MTSLSKVAALVFACRALRHDILFDYLFHSFKIFAVDAGKRELSPSSPNFPNLPLLAAQLAGTLPIPPFSIPHDNFISQSTITSLPRRKTPFHKGSGPNAAQHCE